MISLLYVDDEEGLLDVGRIFLETTGDFSVTTALSAKEAFAVLKNREIDCIVSDYQMPVMDGIAFLKTLRQTGCLIPFILFTGRGREEVAIEALNNGADYYLQKGGDPVAQFAELSHQVRLAVRRKRTEQALADSERRLQEIIHGSPIPQFVIDRDHRVISWNRALEEISGIRAQDILGTTDAWKAFYPEKRPVLADIIVNNLPENVHHWYAGKSGRSRYVDDAFDAIDFFPHEGRPGTWLCFTAAPLRDGNGNIIGAVETLEDVTSLKEKEIAVTESKVFLDKIINSIADPIFVKDREHRWVLLNDACCQLIGRSREVLIGRSDRDFFPKEEADRFQEKDEIVFTSGKENISEEPLTDARGKTHIIVTKKTLYTDTAGNAFIVGVIRDITDRKVAEEAIRLSMEEAWINADRLKRAQAVAHTGSWEYDPVTGKIWGSDEGFRIYGMVPPPGNDLPIGEIEACIPERERVHRALTDLLERDLPYDLEFAINPADGSPQRIITSVAEAQRDPDGTVRKVVGVIQDVTERRRAEGVLAESEEKYRSLVEHNPFGVLLTRPDGRILSANAAACRILGRTEEEIRTAGRAGIVDMQDPRVAAALDERERTGTAIGRVMTFVRKDGTRFDAEVSSTIFHDRNGERMTSMIITIPAPPCR
ncbi:MULTISPECIES: response regulator [unclassified Methanoregula]|uniref:PAS domain-containing response regulator n=1 Tax=unclassified Methanoregula TaxID=2649730 RepID=UPI0009CB6D87|nr:MULTISPECIES: response regulator [unclassified Methanoregula]OPX65361.1 MAG: aerobic respiration control sensor protein ArcB [Methanoregula sp. PtaB.Bin085]OPY32270.1 MAG: aerobic respiration control sensor protein ArcB [Methanoregula sp. PtaU1.Bin006]